MAEYTRRNLWLPDELWEWVVVAAGDATVKEGRRVSASEIIRRAIERLRAEEERARDAA